MGLLFQACIMSSSPMAVARLIAMPPTLTLVMTSELLPLNFLRIQG